jgi:hypothetical protein
MEDHRECSDRKIVSRCRKRAGRVYYDAVFEVKKEIRVRTFYSLNEARVVIERWRVHYNTVRPHTSLGYRPPAPQAVLLNEMGHGDMENAARFPHLHTHDDDYGVLSKTALH